MSPRAGLIAGVMAMGCAGAAPAAPPQRDAAPGGAVVARPVPVRESSPKAPPQSASDASLQGRLALFDRMVFSSPSAVAYDADRDIYWVSNLNTDGERSGGFISKLHPDGAISTLNFIEARKPEVTLDAPRGLAVSGDFLFVADLTSIRKFRADTGEAAGSIDVPGAAYLSDVAVAADGSLYATDVGGDPAMASLADSGRDAIFQITAAGEVSEVARRPDLGGPFALLADEKGLWVTCTGTNQLLLIVPDSAGAPAADAGRLDLPIAAPRGLAAIPDGTVVISSAADGSIYRGFREGPFEAVVTGLESPADLAYDPRRKRLLIPLLTGHAVAVFELPPFKPEPPSEAP